MSMNFYYLVGLIFNKYKIIFPSMGLQCGFKWIIIIEKFSKQFVDLVKDWNLIDIKPKNVKFENHISIGYDESYWKGIMQWNNQDECTLSKEFMTQISDYSDKNCVYNHNINLCSLINNTMIIQ